MVNAHIQGMPVAGGSIQKVVNRWSLCALCVAASVSVVDATDNRQQPTGSEQVGHDTGHDTGHGSSSKELREQAIANLPTARLTREAHARIMAIAGSPTIYRRLPSQAIDCDRDMFLFLARNPEVMVGIWDLMGITKVKTTRLGPYQLDCDDGSGTKCTIDLVYGDPHVHVFVTEGSYDGMLTARPLKGKAVVILTSSYAEAADDRTTVTGSIDFFMQVDSLGIDLVARTLSGLIGRSADYNFIETARFVGQISQASERNPPGMIDVATRMPQLAEPTRQQFIQRITDVGLKRALKARTAERPVVLQR
jgi:hypothetical protein